MNRKRRFSFSLGLFLLVVFPGEGGNKQEYRWVFGIAYRGIMGEREMWISLVGRSVGWMD